MIHPPYTCYSLGTITGSIIIISWGLVFRPVEAFRSSSTESSSGGPSFRSYISNPTAAKNPPSAETKIATNKLPITTGAFCHHFSRKAGTHVTLLQEGQETFVPAVMLVISRFLVHVGLGQTTERILRSFTSARSPSTCFGIPYSKGFYRSPRSSNVGEKVQRRTRRSKDLYNDCEPVVSLKFRITVSNFWKFSFAAAEKYCSSNSSSAS